MTIKDRIHHLIDDLLENPAETAWLEFKENNIDVEAIGEYISALSNAACLADKIAGYLLWGVSDTRSIIGTTFEPTTTKHKNQPIDLWLSQHLRPAINFTFEVVNYHGKRLVLLKIPAAHNSPVEFNRSAYVRVGSAKTKLSDHPERMRALWTKLQSHAWESGIATPFLDGEDILLKLDYAKYFEMTGQRLPDNRNGIFEKLAAEHLIEKDVGKYWNITNLGAILFARQLTDFPSAIARKAIRFVAYKGVTRADNVSYRQDGQLGYAVGFSGLIGYINGLLPNNEYIGDAFREERPLYPSIAIRELIANAIIHQDMTISGAGPLVEMFQDRIEITNPGEPLVQPERFLDLPPRSRNEALAALMRRMRICEEQGTGIDKVLTAVELHQLPAPDFRADGNSVRVILYAPRRFAEMTQQERVRACYQHAALCYVSNRKMTNASLRERLGIEAKNAAQATNVIKKALHEGLICLADPEHPKTGYYPYWAQADKI